MYLPKLLSLRHLHSSQRLCILN